MAKVQQIQSGTSVTLPTLIALRHQIHGIQLNAKQRVKYRHNGIYVSSFRGRGIDFDEVRIYQTGDEIRNMDWRVTARTGKPHTKLFKEERERPVYLVIDLRPNMIFATKVAYKSIIAVQAASIIAWASAKLGDRIGGYIFTHDNHYQLKPRLGTKGVLPLLHKMAELTQELSPEYQQMASSYLNQQLQRIRQVIKPGSLLIMLSDFANLDVESERHIAHLARYNDVIAGFIYDQVEKFLPPAGRYSFSDGKRILSINSGHVDVRQQYQQRFIQHYQRLQQLFNCHGVKWFSLATHDDISKRLREALR